MTFAPDLAAAWLLLLPALWAVADITAQRQERAHRRARTAIRMQSRCRGGNQ